VPITFVSTNASGPRIERSTCDFRREMDNGVNVLFAQEILDERRVADVAPDEAEFGPTLRRFEIGEVACVSQRIEHDQPGRQDAPPASSARSSSR